MSNETDLDIDNRITNCVVRIENLVQAGHVAAVTALEPLCQLRVIAGEHGEEIAAGYGLRVVEALLDAMNDAPARAPVAVPAPADFEQRARSLCADLLELSADEDGWDDDGVCTLRQEARVLLTGTDASVVHDAQDRARLAEVNA